MLEGHHDYDRRRRLQPKWQSRWRNRNLRQRLATRDWATTFLNNKHYLPRRPDSHLPRAMGSCALFFLQHQLENMVSSMFIPISLLYSCYVLYPSIYPCYVIVCTLSICGHAHKGSIKESLVNEYYLKALTRMIRVRRVERAPRSER